MARVNIRFGGVMGGGAVVYQAGGRCADISTSAVSSVSSISAEAGDYVRIVVSGGDVRIATGKSPVAAAPGMLVLDGGVLDIGPLQSGDRVAAIDA